MIKANWVLIQTNRNNPEPDLQRIKVALETLGRTVAVTGLKQVYEEFSELPVMENVVPYGPVRAVEFGIAQHGWLPWLALGLQTCTTYYLLYREHLVNSDYVILPLSAVVPRWSEFVATFGSKDGQLFVRPNESDKIFPASLMTFEDVQQLNGALNPSPLVAVSSCKEVRREWRCFMRRGTFLTASVYAEFGKRVRKTCEVPGEIRQFAEQMAQFVPSGFPPVWVIDIAETAAGLKVMEIADTLSTGFYEANHERILEAVSVEADAFFNR